MIAAFLIYGKASGKNESSTDQNVRSEDKTTIGGIYYYDPERADRYNAYKEQNPQLSDDDIVWQVDVDLDKPAYEDVEEIKDPGDLLTLVSKHRQLPESYEPGNLVALDISGNTIIENVNDEFEKMRTDADKEGIIFFGQSGYRSYATQGELYNKYKKKDPEEVDEYSARPGFSEHQLGTTIDINLGNTYGSLRNFTGTPEAEWVRENAYKYGFIIRYTEKNEYITGFMPEAWHVRYVGTDVASEFRYLGYNSFEEYWVKHVLYTPPDH